MFGTTEGAGVGFKVGNAVGMIVGEKVGLRIAILQKVEEGLPAEDVVFPCGQF